MNREQKIIQFAKENQMLGVGICTPEPFEQIRKELEMKNSSLSGFVEQDIEKRIDPKLTMPDVKSIIVLAMGYKKQYEFQNDTCCRGEFSMGAIGLDYHIVLKQAFLKLEQELQQYGTFESKVFVDTGPLSDRAVALRAKVGILLKNGSICTPEGSMVFIGYMMTNLELEPSQTTLEITGCGQCRNCIIACPGNAIGEDGSFYFEKCTSYLTQKKGLLTKKEADQIGSMIYGCDICQRVCPKNKQQPCHVLKEIDTAKPKIEEILLLSNRGFLNRFGQTAIGWRGKNIIQRNALIALSNQNGERAMEQLKQFEKDEREVIRLTAKMALGRKEEENWDIGIQED